MLLLTLTLLGCRNDPCRPVDAGDRQSSLRATLEVCLAASGAPGALIAVHDGQDTWTAAAGFSDIDAGVSMVPADIFRGGSTTKTVTAALILDRVAAGELSLDDPLSRWVPDFPSGELITVRHLLNQTGGVADYMDADLLAAERRSLWTPERLLEVGASLGPLSDVGEAFHYANTNYVALGLILEQVTGRPYHEHLRETLLDPLGLDSVALDGFEPLRGALVRGYTDAHGWRDIGDRNHPTVTWAAAGITTDARDLARWGHQLFAGAVLPPELLVDMTSPPTDDGYPYGLGVTLYDTPVGPAVGQKGRTAGHYSWLGHFPELGLTVATYSNTSEDFADPRPAAWAAVELLTR